MLQLEKDIYSLIETYREKYLNNEVLDIGVMVSGGVDSMVLIHLLHKHKQKLNILPIVIHVDFNDYDSHQLSRILVSHYCKDNEIPAHFHSSDLGTLGSGVKLKARADMKEFAFDEEYDLVLTAHHKDDQIETILFRFLRATGPDGIEGMLPLSSFVRNGKTRIFGKPFLQACKKEIISTAKKLELPYVHDESNDDISTSRNYLRHKVIPLLKERFDLDNIVKSSKLLSAKEKEEPNLNIDILSGKYKIEDFINLSVGNRLFVIKKYLASIGFNINKDMHKAIKAAMREDLTNLHVNVSKTITVSYNHGYITVNHS